MIIIPNVNKENSCFDCPVWSLCWDSKPTEDICKDRCPIVEFEGVRLFDDDMPTIEAEPTFEQLEEYCRKRCLVVVDVALFNEMKSRWSAEPRKHGHWIWRGGNLYECSECGAIVVAQDYIPIELHYFCRGCGADMREVKE